MNWQLPATHQSLYLRVIALITHAIETGALLPGEKLPAERQLAEKLVVNRSTIQHALNELVSNGLLVRKVGSGTWVSTDKWGVLPENVNWQNYLSTNRFGDPANYLTRLRAMETEPDVINLAHFNISPELALPISLNHVSAEQLIDQETSVNLSGATVLKRQLVQHLTPLLQQAIQPDQILITSGAQQAFYLITQGLLSYGDAIAIEKPSYFYQLALFQVAGIRVFGIPLQPDGSLDLVALQKAYYKHHFRFLFVNPNGQNPTGMAMPLAKRRALIKVCQQLKLPIVEDDPFGISNALNPTSPIVPLKALDPNNVLYVGSLSSLVGSHTRIGWLLAPASLVTRLADIRQQMEAGMSIFPQLIATQFLAQPNLADQVNQQTAQLRQRTQWLHTALQPLADDDQLTYQQPTVDGSSFWVQLNVNRSLTAADYDQFLTHQVLVRPDFLFGAHQNHIRLGVAYFTKTQISELRTRLTQILTHFNTQSENPL
ncbi:PLP-dependent aminotransferase family protein [Secundilactobacillus similis]|uniref:GntR family transcriptional regulator n=1 Tax=Secundilactobacillus similis DSM 23365 = JCM 2765 TaxID=1423804 RepID=A0A0R2FCV5_9LACO|nr:PLP-dependent aminotransferase family protein [Secundilactobacillus similis]KRN26264.1 GntR family transcriptional regulator [Secundilactobacillus similis DSM 23365 = JCM 2765]